MLFSIIVPVYNAGKFLGKTIESVISQSFSDWQLILVNDGSTDNSLEICQEYSVQEPRILVLSQRNLGVSAARNAGTDAAQGKYILFLDSDDEYQPGALNAVANLIEQTNVDLVVSSSKVLNVDQKIVLYEQDYVLPERFKSLEDFYIHMRLVRMAPGPCRYAVKRELLWQNSVYFPLGISMAEDCLWLCKMLKHIKSSAYNTKPFYQYNIHENSLTTTIRFSKLENVMFVCDEIFQMAENTSGELKKLYLSYCNILACSMLQHYSKQQPRNRKRIREWFAHNETAFQNSLKIRRPLGTVAAVAGSFNTLLLHAKLVVIKNMLTQKG